MSVEKPVPVMDAAVAVANEWNAAHPSAARPPSSFIAHAWVEQIRSEANASASSWSDEMRRKVAISRRLAGEYADDIVLPCIGQQPMYHTITMNDKSVVCIGAMLGGCVPLWTHYYWLIVRLESMIAVGE